MNASEKFGTMLMCMVGDEDATDEMAGNWWYAHAPEPETPYPEPPEGWEEDDDDDNTPHWDTPGGY